MPKILVHEKALAHLSRGLYRSPASALRELVSNAWDANATEVRINTNYPLFYQLSIVDNGDGLTRKDFIRIMGGGIGNSIKRVESKELIHNRPTIGRLGIGLLGIAQICGGFTIMSRPKVGKGFRSKVKLYDLLREKLDTDDESIVDVEGNDGDAYKEIDVGEYEWEEFDESSMKYGTVIIADDVHPTFIRSFQNSLKFENYKEPSLDWEKSLKIVSKVRSLQELGDYWRLLWELAVSCPVPYINEKALPDGLLLEIQKNLVSYNFRVLVDGIDLKKPISLKKNEGGYTSYKIQRQTTKVYGRDLVFHGYLVVQEGAQLKPDELRGVLVRVRNIGIGYYDPSMLDYRYNEGPRSRWLTGEIYVEEGLENALNIDRDSFNRFHPEFRAVQEFVHKILHEKIFPVSYKKIEDRSSLKKETKSKNRVENFKKILSEKVDSPVKFSFQKEEAQSVQAIKTNQKEGPQSGQTIKTKISVESNRVTFELPNQDALKTKKSYRELASFIITIFEVAIKEKDVKKQREVFSELLLKLLEGW